MFYSSEDLNPAVAAAKKIFGTVGNIDLSSSFTKNVSVFTPEYGKLWYGDVRGDDLETKRTQLESIIKKKVFIFTELWDDVTEVI